MSAILGLEILQEGVRRTLLRRGKVIADPEQVPSDALTISALPTSTVLVRTLRLDVTTKIDQVLPFQAEPLFPFEDPCFAYQIIEKDEEGVLLTVMATEKASLEDQPGEQVSSIPAALATLSGDEAEAMIHRGEETTCLVAKEGKLLAAHALPKDASEQEILRVLTAFRRQGHHFDQVRDDLGENAIGRGLVQSQINFRPDSAFPWKRLRKSLLVLTAMAVALALSLSFLGSSLASRKSAAIEESFHRLQRLAGQEPTHLSADQMVIEAQRIGRELQATPNTFALVPDIPRLKDSLAWLATFPNIRLEKLSYAMVRRPTSSRPKEPYQVRLDLDFTATSPTAAREFHDALLAGQPLIDPNSEIKWSAKGSAYRTSFFLTDKTRYP